MTGAWSRPQKLHQRRPLQAATLLERAAVAAALAMTALAVARPRPAAAASVAAMPAVLGAAMALALHRLRRCLLLLQLRCLWRRHLRLWPLHLL